MTLSEYGLSVLWERVVGYVNGFYSLVVGRLETTNDRVSDVESRVTSLEDTPNIRVDDETIKIDSDGRIYVALESASDMTF